MSAPAAPIVDPIARTILGIRDRLRTRFDKRWAMPIVPVPLSVGEFKRVASVTPFLAIGLLDMDSSGARALGGPATMAVVAGVKNASNHDARFLGDAAGPGLYPTLVLAAALLNGHTIEPVGTLSVAKLATAYTEGFTDEAVATGIITITSTLSFRDAIADPTAPPDFAGLSPWVDGSFVTPFPEPSP